MKRARRNSGLSHLQAAIGPEAALDYQRWPNAGSSSWYRDDRVPFGDSVQTVKRFIEARRIFLLRDLTRL